MKRDVRSVAGLMAAGFIGATLALAFGADKPPAVVAPRYSVQYAGVLVLITDNEAHKMYTYQNGEKSSKLIGYVDLKQTGQLELVLKKAE